MKSFFAISLVSFLFFSAAQARVDRVIQIQATTENKSANERTVDRYSYNFGQVFINSSRAATYRLKNTGVTDLTFDDARISGTDYRASHSCTEVLHPGSQCSFTIRFFPFFEGYQSGEFILSFKEDLDIVVQLWGEGVRF